MKKKKIDYMVYGVFIYWIAFVITMTVIFCIKGSVPDTLIQCGLGGGAFELFCAALVEIKSNKKGEKG